MNNNEKEAYRLFVAIELPDDVKSILSDVQQRLKKVRKIPVNQMHLTIRFIGDVPSDRVASLRSMLRAIAMPNFSLNIKGVGFFPNSHRPKVVWAGIEENDQLQKLYENIEAVIVDFGEDPDQRSFSPHITLGRIKYAKKGQYDRFIKEYRELEIPDIEVNDFILFRSVLSQKGARHIPLERYSLS